MPHLAMDSVPGQVEPISSSCRHEPKRAGCPEPERSRLSGGLLPGRRSTLLPRRAGSYASRRTISTPPTTKATTAYPQSKAKPVHGPNGSVPW